MTTCDTGTWLLYLMSTCKIFCNRSIGHHGVAWCQSRKRKLQLRYDDILESVNTLRALPTCRDGTHGTLVKSSPFFNCTDTKHTLRLWHLMIEPDSVSQTTAVRILLLSQCCSRYSSTMCGRVKLSLHSAGAAWGHGKMNRTVHKLQKVWMGSYLSPTLLDNN